MARQVRRSGPQLPAPLIAAVTAVLLVTGCGVSGNELSPGRAAEVGGTTISLDTVDTAARAYCAYNESSESEPTVTGYAGRTLVLEGLVLRAVADGMNAEYHKAPGEIYTSQVSQATDKLSGLDPAQLDDVLPAVTGSAYFYDLVAQFGAGSAAYPTTNAEASADFDKGLTLAMTWVQSHPIVTDPSLPAISLSENNLAKPFDHDLSQGVSSFAQAASQAAEPTPTGSASDFAESLPASQRCG